MYDFLLGRMYFAGNDGYWSFCPNAQFPNIRQQKKVTNWTTGVSSEKIKPFGTNLEPIMFHLANGRVSSLHSNFILNLYIVYIQLNTWPPNATINISLKNCLFGTVKLTSNADKSKFTDNVQEIAFDEKRLTLLELLQFLVLIIHHLILIILKITFQYEAKDKLINGINGSVGTSEKNLVSSIINKRKNFA